MTITAATAMTTMPSTSPIHHPVEAPITLAIPNLRVVEETLTSELPRGHSALQFGAERLGGHHLGEHRIVELERVLVLLGGGRRDAVRERDHLVALLVAAAHRRLHAAVREEAAERDRRDAARAQDEVEVGRREGVEAALAFHDHVA